MYPLRHARLLLGFLGVVSCARVPENALKPSMPRTFVDISDPPPTDTTLPAASDPPPTDTTLPAASAPPHKDTTLPAASDPPHKDTMLPAASDPPPTDTTLPAASDPPPTDTTLPAASDPPHKDTTLPAASDPPHKDTMLPAASDPPHKDTMLPAASDPPPTDTTLPAASDPPPTDTTLPAASDPPHKDTTLPAASDPPHKDTTLPAASDPPHKDTTLPAASDPPHKLSNGNENTALTPATRLSKASEQLENLSERLKKLDRVPGNNGNVAEERTSYGVSGRGDDEGNVKGKGSDGESDWKSTYESDDEDETDDDAEYIDLDDGEPDREEEYEYEDDEGDDTEDDDEGDEGGNSQYSGAGEDDDDDDSDEYDHEESDNDFDEERDDSEDNYDENEYDGYIQSYWDSNSDDDDEDNHDEGEDNRDYLMDSDEEMVFMYLLGNESSALAPFTLSQGQDPLGVLPRDVRHTSPVAVAVTDDEISATGTLAVMGAGKNAEEHVGSQRMDGDGRQTPYLLGDGYVPRGETMIMLTEEQIQHLSVPGTVRNTSEETEESTGKHEYEGETSGEDSWQETPNSPAPPSSDATHHYKFEAITEEELEEILKTYHDFIQTEEQWEGSGGDETSAESSSGTEGNRHVVTGISIETESENVTEMGITYIVQEDTESTQGGTQHLKSPTSHSPSGGNKPNGLETTSLTSGGPGLLSSKNQTFTDLDNNASSLSTVIPALSRTYNELTKSDQLTAEEKVQLSILERLRRTVEALGGEDTLRRNPKLHHIVKRQLEGNEACRVLSRRRRAVDGDHPTRREMKSEVEELGEELVRVRRGVVNVGRRLEQGNAGYKQLYSQYKKMCEFIAMAVFEK